MIRNLIVYINSDRSVFPKELKIANQFEIKTNEIKFIFDGDIPRTGYPYLILTNRNGSFYLPLVDDSVVFGNQETWIMGGWSAHIMISEAEIINGIVNKSEKLFISDDFGLWVEPSDINIDDLKEQQIPTPLKLLYDDLFALKERVEEILDGGLSDGKDGVDGVSPTVSVSKSGKVTTITINDVEGTKTATINDGLDGKDGSNGQNGKDGTSVTVSNVSESTADGGSNVVTFSDGKSITIKNGSKGSKGDSGQDGADGHTPVKGVDYFDGQNGKDGQDGKDGVSISSVTQTTTSSEDGGTNIVQVTLSNGNKSSFQVKNGSKGSKGDKGDTGPTGPAYTLTASDKASITASVKSEIDPELKKLKESIADLDVIVTPQMYGAVGDGVTDDTQAFKNALSENNIIYVPKGNYLIKDTLNMVYKKVLYGDSRETTTLIYGGSANSPVVNIGRMSIFRNIGITINTPSFSSAIFNTNNKNSLSALNAVHSSVENAIINFSGSCPNASVIAITVDSGTDVNNKPTQTGLCYQHYKDIFVANGKYGYGIKMELIQGRPFTEATKDGFPWITHIVFQNIYLANPKVAIKAGVTNTSGAEWFERINIGSIFMDNVSSQYVSQEDTQKYLEVDHFSANLTNCIAWDYHPLLIAGKMYNTANEGTSLSMINCEKPPLETFEFPNETELNSVDSPEYFIEKYFPSTLSRNGFDTIDQKIASKVTDEYIGRVTEDILNEILFSGYSNLMTHPLTVVKYGVRFSNSSQTWGTSANCAVIIIPAVTGGNIVRYVGNYAIDLAPFKSVFFFNDDTFTTGVYVGATDELTVTNGDETYLQITNLNGYKYIAFPVGKPSGSGDFVPFTADNTIVTINREIDGGSTQSFIEFLNDQIVHPKVPTKTSELTNDSGFITKDDIPEQEGINLSDYAETWTFTLADGTTVTKKVVLA